MFPVTDNRNRRHGYEVLIVFFFVVVDKNLVSHVLSVSFIS